MKMSQISVSKTPINGLYIIENKYHSNSRGYFTETYNYNDFADEGLGMVFVQDNESRSEKGVLRGLHFQKQYPQGKLVSVLDGRVFHVVVDLWDGLPTFGEWYGVELTENNHKQFYMSPGFAHGFLVLSEYERFAYKCTDFYQPGDEGGLPWNDPDIGIEWPDIKREYNGSASPEGWNTDLFISKR